MEYRVSLACINTPHESRVHVDECLERGAVGQSIYVEKFEAAVAQYTGARYCIAVCNGTLADAVAMAALADAYSLRRVVIPALTFVAQANAARYSGLEVVWCDVSPNWTLDWSRAELLGEAMVCYADLMGRMRPIPLGPRVVEDACEAFGSELNGVKAGRFGMLGTFSFFVSHTITTGEGGAIITDDDDLAFLCRSIRSHGRASETQPFEKFKFPLPGFNAKMSGLTAAYGLGVMAHIAEYVERRHRNWQRMNRALGGRFRTLPEEKVVPHGYPIGFDGEKTRDRAMSRLLSLGVECRKFFSCLPTMERAWAESGHQRGDFPNAEAIADRYLYVPCHQEMSEADVDFVADSVLAQSGLVNDYLAEIEGIGK